MTGLRGLNAVTGTRCRAGSVLVMVVVANGDPVELPPGATVDDLLRELGLGGRWVLVERNGEPVNRRELATTVLAEGDRLELVRAVAGG
ncbi:MAG TPA: sulfur carrier protein ThiS [Acidimicrobiales bacterium]|nr:sulfur carrier protein ThiS [Acidimicrobiales bacterium]